MAGCPYTWIKSFLGQVIPESKGEATSLRVKVTRDQRTTVDVTLPARSARWLIDVIPTEVVTKIRAEGIPLDQIQADLSAAEVLVPGPICTLEEPHRIVLVWLE